MAVRSSILVVGAGGHARACIDVIESGGHFSIVGLLGQPNEVGGSVFDYPVIGCDVDIPSLAKEVDAAVIALGQVGAPGRRACLFRDLRASGFSLPSLVSPRAVVSRHATLGAGTIIMHGAIVNANAKIGSNCIVNSRALIEHDVSINDHCHISTAAVINGSAHVGRGCFVGSGAIIRDRVRLGNNCFIGMGQRIIADCDSDSRVTAMKDI